MKLDDIIKLIDAGYTKADIEAMETSAADPQQHDETVTPEPQPAPENTPVNTSDQEPAPAPAAQDPILAALDRLTNTIMSRNINQTVIQPAERTPEKALAEIIAPPARNKGGA